MKYHHLKNPFFNSNTFIVEYEGGKIVIIDPGNPDVEPLISLINKNQWLIEGVILTHEHADHIAGLPELCRLKNFPIYCSKNTAINVNNSKMNLSKYIDEIETFELNIAAHVLFDNEIFNVGCGKFLFLETPGHSPGGACFLTENAVFTGDTMFNKTKVPLNLPNSNKVQYDLSLEKIQKQIKLGITIYPGHGEPFIYGS